jgi:hypothetical protein
MATAAKYPVKLTITNPTSGTVRGRVRLAGFSRTAVEPAEIQVLPLQAGASQTSALTLVGGSGDELGEVKAQVAAAELVREGKTVSFPAATVAPIADWLPVSVGVTRYEDVRHKLPFSQATDDRTYSPVWIVRAPAYEIWFSERSGLARTMLDSSNHAVYASPWANISGLCEFWREVNGPGDYRCIHGGDPECRPRRMTWHDTTLQCEAVCGDRITVECAPRYVHWHVRAAVEKLLPRGYGMRLHGLFGHPSFTPVHSDDKDLPAGWPAKLRGMPYCCVQRPGNPSGSIWIAVTGVVPRCTANERGIAVEWHGLMKPEFDMYLGIAPGADQAFY